jgi:hypothetical protein
MLQIERAGWPVIQKYTRANGVDIAPMKDQMVLFNPHSNQFCVLNRTAAIVWELLETPRSIDEISIKLVENFSNAPSQTVVGDVRAMLADLEKTACVAVVNT